MNNSRTPQFYMANLGSEVAGIYSALAKNDTSEGRKRYERAKKIIGEWRHLERRSSAVAEMNLLEEIIDDFFSKTPRFKIPKTDLEHYFLPFALRAMSV